MMGNYFTEGGGRFLGSRICEDIENKIFTPKTGNILHGINCNRSSGLSLYNIGIQNKSSKEFVTQKCPVDLDYIIFQ
jgi:hypothetical protein